MRFRTKLTLMIVVFHLHLFAEGKSLDTLSIVSWNIQNLGKSKSDLEVRFMASILIKYDLIAIQEVVAGQGGAQAVARLVEELKRKGSNWDYTISPPTSGLKGSSERYAFIWKTSRIKLFGKAFLEPNYSIEIDREPYIGTFIFRTDTFNLASFHAIPKSKQPETEIKYLRNIYPLYSNRKMLFVGDFNCPQSHSVFGPLKKMGFKNAFTNQKTTLKKGCKSSDCLASEYDNIFYPQRMRLIYSKVILFQLQIKPPLAVEGISDHLPIVGYFLY